MNTVSSPRVLFALCCTSVLAAACGGSQDDAPDTATAAQTADHAAPRHLLLFGGITSERELLGDTWTWDGRSWTKHDVAGPSVRWAAVGGKVAGKAVVFGGAGEVQNGGVSKDDTWTWDGERWARLDVPGPASRELAEGGTVGDRFVVYGGYTFNGSGTNDVWSFDGQKWTELQPNRGVAHPAPGQPFISIGLVTATMGDSLWLTNGSGVWTWRGGTWMTAAVTAKLPTNRTGAGAATLGGKPVLFGGVASAGGGGPLDDTWTWDGTSFVQVGTGTHPAARSDAAMATLGSEVVLFGGATGGDHGSDFGDTWTWDGTTWTLHDVPGPSPRTPAVLVAY